MTKNTSPYAQFHPCFTLLDAECTATELFMLKDAAVRFCLFYSTAWIVWILMRKTKQNLVKFHRILVGTSCGTLAFLVFIQGYVVRVPRISPLENSMFQEFLICHSLAVVLSAWTIWVVDVPYIESMKWSTPANSLFSGAVVNLFVATACFQAYWKSGGIEEYFATRQLVSPRVVTCFLLGGIWSLVHGALLIQVRSFLDVRQLQSVCIAKAVICIVLPLIWCPEMSFNILNIDQRLTMAIRVYLLINYIVGAWLAGKAEGMSRILTSEKDQ